jgi:Holliday junction resolvase RusA-like endonuclease
MRIEFTVRGNPKALKRHRTYRRGSKLIQVDPSKDEKQDFLVLAHAHAPSEPITSGVGLYLWFYMPIPKSWPKYKKKEAEKKAIPHEKRPDLSNLVKFCEDALLGVFYSDDSLISRTTAFKLYSDTPRTHCIIEYQEGDEIIEIRDKVRDVLNGIAPINDDLLGEIQKISLYACPTCNGRGYFMDSDDYKEFEMICDCVVDKTEV